MKNANFCHAKEWMNPGNECIQHNVCACACACARECAYAKATTHNLWMPFQIENEYNRNKHMELWAWYSRSNVYYSLCISRCKEHHTFWINIAQNHKSVTQMFAAKKNDGIFHGALFQKCSVFEAHSMVIMSLKLPRIEQQHFNNIHDNFEHWCGGGNGNGNGNIL